MKGRTIVLYIKINEEASENIGIESLTGKIVQNIHLVKACEPDYQPRS